MNLQDFSRRKFDPKQIPDPFSDNFPNSWPGPSEMLEIDPKLTAGKVKYGSFGLAIGPFGLGFGPYGSKLV